MSTVRNANGTYTQRFTIRAGRVIAGQVKAELRRSAFENGIDLQVEEEKTLLQKTFMFKATANLAVLKAWLEAVDKWLESID